MIHIVTDASADLPPGWAEKYQIHVLPLLIRVGNHTYTSSELSHARFYQLLEENRGVPRTSLPSTSAIVDFYRSIVRKGDKILSVHASGKLSSLLTAVEAASRELKNEITVTPYDSKAGSIAMGFMCREARIMEMAGYNIQAMANQMDAIKKQMTVVFTLDTLDYVRSNGKVSVNQGIFSAFSSSKPVVMLKDGNLETVETEKTRSNAILRVVQLAERQTNKKSVHIAVVHANAASASLEMVAMVRERFTCRELVVSEMSIPVAANLGPGTVGIVAYPDALS